MKMTQIVINETNVVAISREENVYVIGAYKSLTGHFMHQANRASIEDLLDPDNIVVKIEN